MVIKQIIFNYSNYYNNNALFTNKNTNEIFVPNSVAEFNNIKLITENIIPSGGRCIKLGIQAPRDTIFKMLPYIPTGSYESNQAQRFLIGPSEIYELSDCSIGYLEFVVQQDTNGEDISLKNIIIDMIIEEGGIANE